MHVKIGDQFSIKHYFDTASSQAFARAAGDLNPLHHDEKLAQNSRFGGLIASGTQTTALMMGLTASHFAQFGPTVGMGFTFRFRRPVPMNAHATISWTVTDLTAKPGTGVIVTCTGALTLDATGEAAVTGTSQGVLLDAP
jgi:acyl dehydratase